MFTVNGTELFKLLTDNKLIGNFKYGNFPSVLKKYFIRPKNSKFSIVIRNNAESLLKEKLSLGNFQPISFYNYSGIQDEKFVSYVRPRSFFFKEMHMSVENIFSDEIRI